MHTRSSYFVLFHGHDLASPISPQTAFARTTLLNSEITKAMNVQHLINLGFAREVSANSARSENIEENETETTALKSHEMCILAIYCQFKIRQLYFYRQTSRRS